MDKKYNQFEYRHTCAGLVKTPLMAMDTTIKMLEDLKQNEEITSIKLIQNGKYIKNNINDTYEFKA